MRCIEAAAGAAVVVAVASGGGAGAANERPIVFASDAAPHFRRTSNPYVERSAVCMATVGRGVRCLGRGSWRSDAPEWSRDGTRIVFTSMRDGDSEVYVVGVRGGAWRKITTTSRTTHTPVVKT